MSNNVELHENYILGLGNPLLDIIANVNNDFLEKYDMKPNNAILADEKHENLCTELAEKFDVNYIAGGAVQNTMRVAQWFFNRPHVTTFFGSIGADEYGERMREIAKKDQVNVSYYVDPDTLTGTCACLITKQGKNRSLCAYLGASQKFNYPYLKENFHLVEQSKIIYTSGFHLMVCFEASLSLAKHAHEVAGKLFTMNLSAPYIAQVCSEQLNQIIPYVDILFGNETEAQAFADIKGWNTNDVAKITQMLADVEHKRPRTVVITQGAADVLVAFTNRPEEFAQFKVDLLSEEQIVDTNCAGDSFVGGFLAYKAIGQPLAKCVEAGIYAAQQIIQMSGCTLPEVNKYRI